MSMFKSVTGGSYVSSIDVYQRTWPFCVIESRLIAINTHHRLVYLYRMGFSKFLPSDSMVL